MAVPSSGWTIQAIDKQSELVDDLRWALGRHQVALVLEDDQFGAWDRLGGAQQDLGRDPRVVHPTHDQRWDPHLAKQAEQLLVSGHVREADPKVDRRLLG